MLRRHGHRKACGNRARVIRSLMEAGLEEAAWKRREPAAREQLIALRREKRQPATARRLIVRRLSLTLSEPIARKRQEPAAREMLTVPRRERHSPETNQPLIVREGSLARTPCGTTAQKQLESTEPALRRLMSGGLPPGIWR